ncbi:MAG: hypothetical protein ABIC82_00355 [bacterium]
MVFRLNNDFQARHGAGYEPTELCSKFPQFSSKKIADTLNFFIAALKNSKGIERNLLAKRFLEKITYAPEKIEMSLILSQNPADFGGIQKTAPRMRGGAKCLSKNLFSEKQKSKNEFVSLNSARG